jgi:uncharacterized protein (DUF849 family)
MHKARIMVAPNGARRSKADHPALPMTIEEIAETAAACHEAGAHAIHVHVRDAEGHHTLDPGLYAEAIAAIEAAAPKMGIQITTEAVGRYSPEEQRAVVETVSPDAVSVALREMVVADDKGAARRFYHWADEAGIDLQHILYSPDEVIWLRNLVRAGDIPRKGLSVLFVLGRYAENQQSHPSDLSPFMNAWRASGLSESSRFMVCAFGRAETDCLLASAAAGGDCRIGFENNLKNRDGKPALDNAARVRELVLALATQSTIAKHTANMIDQ